jgi:2-dehydropantoate 2-reductase
MKIAVIGAGAVGGYFGGRLTVSGSEVVYLVRGAWQLREAASAIQKMPGGKSVVVPLQNGMDAPAELAAVLGPGRVAGGLCRIVAKANNPGQIDHFWAEPSVAFGELEPLANADALVHLRDAFNAARVRCEIPHDIATVMWGKFLFIAPWGSLGGVTQLSIGPLRSAPESRARLVQALQEVAAIARAEGSDLGAESVDKTLATLDALPADTTSSMQRDIMAGRPSELEAQTGAVVRFGRKTRLPTPVHDAIYGELLPLEKRARGLT